MDGWIKMPLGTGVGLGPGDIVLDCSLYNLCCRLLCMEMSEAEGSNSFKQSGPSEGVAKTAKEGKCSRQCSR